jgi:hypothetical protein
MLGKVRLGAELTGVMVVAPPVRLVTSKRVVADADGVVASDAATAKTVPSVIARAIIAKSLGTNVMM